jgi:hypothetical protein
VPVVQSLLLLAVAAIAEIGGAWLIWQGVREDRGVAFIGLGIMALAAYGFVATFQPDPNLVGSSPPMAASSLLARWPGAWWSMASAPTAGTCSGRRSA